MTNMEYKGVENIWLKKIKGWRIQTPSMVIYRGIGKLSIFLLVLVVGAPLTGMPMQGPIHEWTRISPQQVGLCCPPVRDAPHHLHYDRALTKHIEPLLSLTTTGSHSTNLVEESRETTRPDLQLLVCARTDRQEICKHH